MSFKRIFLGLAFLLLAAPSLAASVAERSAFAQGTWWDPTKSGHGFEIFNAGDQVAVTWYTFDDAGRPTWYTSQGMTSTLGTQSWPLLKHRWANGRKAGFTVVGSLRLDFHNAEAADVSWEIGSQKATWAIKPFTLSGVINEVDRSGAWFDPSNSGWGLTISEQGDVLGGALFAYDTAGEPTWVAGYQRRTSNVELVAVSGTCPACAYAKPTTRSVGRISFDSDGETQLTVHSNLTLGVAAGVTIDGARLNQLSRPAFTRPADRQLANFNSDAALKAYLDAGMLNIPPYYGGADFSAAPPVGSYSPTNLQESGVDEADLVKSDGRYVYTFLHDANGNRQAAVRGAVVGNEGATLDVVGSVALASGASSPMSNAGLYLDGTNLVSVTGTQALGGFPSPWLSPYAWKRGTTNIEVLSTATPIPVTRWRAEIDGNIVASRRIGQRVYVVSRFVPELPGFLYGASPTSPAAATNRQILASTPLSGLLPKVRINGGEAAPLVAASAVYVPPQGTRAPLADMMLVTAIDLAEPRVAQVIAIAGPVETIYASSTNLFLASSRYELRYSNGGLIPSEPNVYMTDLHQIRLGTDAMSIVGSGSIEGYLGSDVDKASFRLSEYQGRLRAVTSSGVMWGGVVTNRLTVMEPSAFVPGLLKTVSVLPNAARPESLGKPGEQLYATRFLGERLYAVTFRRIDPLYVVDLADSADPKISGMVEVPGFSEYLHPLPNGLLLGFGRQTSDTAFLGLQLSLFDVSNAGRPHEVQRVTMGQSGSDSALLRDHHAFSSLALAGGSLSIALPARLYTDNNSWQQSGLMRFELRGTGPADARLVEMPNLITHTPSQGGMNYADPASDTGRSILFRDGTVYVGNGQFWRQDTAGRSFGPY